MWYIQPFTFRIGCIYHMGNSWNCSVCFFVAQSAAKRKSIEQVRWDFGYDHGTAFLRSVGSFALLSMRNKRSPDCRQVISGRKFECDLLFSYIAGDPFFYSDICTFSTYIGGTAGKVVRSSQKLAAAGSWPGWFYNIYRNRTSAVGKNSFRTSRQHIFNICSSSLLGDIYVRSIRFDVMARQKRERSNKILQRHFRNMGGQFFYIGTFSAGIYLQRSLVIFKYAEFERNRLQSNQWLV